MRHIINFLLEHYGVCFLIVSVSLFFVIRKYAPRYEPLSILAFVLLFLNYAVLERLLLFFDWLPLSRGDSELLSFLGGFASVVLGIVALMRIRRNHKKGRLLAWIPVALGGLCVLSGLVVLWGLCNMDW